MEKGRLEAFSDGVIAIIITIMVLDLKVPHGPNHSLDELAPLLPTFGSYVLSFVFIGIYWTNHHHLIQASKKITGAILWANLHLLFWLSLIPPANAWMGENCFATWPVAIYGIVLLFAGLAYFILTKLLSKHSSNAALAKALGRDVKGLTSLAIYATAIVVALFHPWIAFSLYCVVAIMWLIPDRRIEGNLFR